MPGGIVPSAGASPRKVLFLIPSLAGGGAERVFSLILTHLDRTRFELHLGVLQDQGAYMKDVPADVTVHRLKISRVRYALPAMVRLAWRVRPNAILSTLGHLNLALILTRPFLPRGTRLLLREAAIPSALLREEAPYPRIYGWLYRHLYKRADGVVCLSDSMMNDMVRHFGVPREKLTRIYNPVDINRVRESAGHGENPYSGAGPHLVAVGRLTRQKGFDILLDALPAVLESLPQAKLTILGEGPLRDDLKDQAQRLGLAEKVTFAGFQPNPWLYLRHADLFVFPSRYEGTSNVLLEALALGTPVVASDCPGGTREMQSCNPQMILVPPENARALAQAIVTVCRMPKGIEGEQQVRQRLRAFDLHEIVGQYSRLLEQV